ncbi:TPA: hypothetical protein DDW35_04605 [Candidatus Sumerlaeota bacterium]|nr:hypothetical protein [Candidatus Sumerlaeota bacterium]
MASQHNRTHHFTSVLVTLSLLAFLFLVAATDLKSGNAARDKAPNPRFYAVQDLLDTGGSFYLYSDTKGLFKKYATQFQTILNNPQMPPETSRIAGIADKVVDRLGVYGLQDVGASAIMDNGMRRMKMFIGSADGRDKGCLSLLGGNPHPLTILDRVSASTLLLLNMDCNEQAAWQLLRDAALDADGLKDLDKALQELNVQSNLDVAALVPSLGGEITFVVDVPSERLQTPKPMPRFALLWRVKNVDAYSKIAASMQKDNLLDAEKTEGKLRMMPFKVLADPSIPPITPVLATDGEYLYVSNDTDYVKDLSAGSKTPLRNSEAFKKLSVNIPTEGNGCFYSSPDAYEKMLGMLDKYADKTPDNPLPALLANAKKQQQPSTGNFTVRVNRPDGILYVGHGMLPALGMLPAVGAGGLASIAVPNFLEAQVRSKVSRAQSDMRSLATAIESYYVDNNKFPVSSEDVSLTPFGKVVQQNPALKQQTTFRTNFGQKVGQPIPVMTLTTPVSYITSYPGDPFGIKGAGTPFCYYNAQELGWLLWSCGPDGEYNMTLEDAKKVYNPAVPNPTKELLTGVGASGKSLTYDATNGTTSSGDIWRVKQ